MAAAKSGNLRLHVANIGRLVIKELRSIRADPIMLALIVYSFTVSVVTVATGASTEARNLAVGVVDEDHSVLSRHLRDALLPPIFQPAVEIPASAIDDEMDHERLVFVLEIPPRFESDLRAGRSAEAPRWSPRSARPKRSIFRNVCLRPSRRATAPAGRCASCVRPRFW